MKLQHLALVLGLGLLAASYGPVANRFSESHPTAPPDPTAVAGIAPGAGESTPEPLRTVAAVSASTLSAKPVKSAPDITLTTTDGRFLLSELREKVVLLYFSFPG